MPTGKVVTLVKLLCGLCQMIVVTTTLGPVIWYIFRKKRQLDAD